MNFFKNWVSYFIIMIIVTLGLVLIGGVSYWLIHFLIGKVFLAVIGISLIMTIVDNYL